MKKSKQIIKIEENIGKFFTNLGTGKNSLNIKVVKEITKENN